MIWCRLHHLVKTAVEKMNSGESRSWRSYFEIRGPV
jgi:hypothetical protein